MMEWETCMRVVGNMHGGVWETCMGGGCRLCSLPVQGSQCEHFVIVRSVSTSASQCQRHIEGRQSQRERHAQRVVPRHNFFASRKQLAGA